MAIKQFTLTLPASLAQYQGGILSPNFLNLEPFVTADGDIDFVYDIFIPHADIPCPVQIYQYDPTTGVFFNATDDDIVGPIPTDLEAHLPVIADFNGDGFPDIFIDALGVDGVGTPGDDRFLLSTSSGQWVDASANLGLPAQGSGGVTSGVIDKNGDIGIFQQTSFNPSSLSPFLYYMISDGDGNFNDVTDTYLPPLTQIDNGAFFADVNGDGLADLICASITDPRFPAFGHSYLEVYLNPGDGDFSQVKPYALPQVPFENGTGPGGGLGYPQVESIVPFIDASGKFDDLIVISTPVSALPNDSGYSIQILMNDGTGHFTDESATRILGAPAVVASGSANLNDVWAFDLTGDGSPDIITRGGGGSPSQIFLNNGHDYFTLAYSLLGLTTPGAPNPLDGFQIQGVADIAGKPTLILESGATVDLLPFEAPPVVANPTPNLNFGEGKTINYQLATNTFTDPEGLALTYVASGLYGAALPSWLAFNATTMTFSGTSPSDAENTTVTVTAYDPEGFLAEDTFDVSSDPAGDAVAPTLKITSAGGLTDQTPQVIKGTIDAVDSGLLVSIYDGSTLIGHATANSAGHWSAPTDLRSKQGAQTITAKATSAAGTGTSSAVGYTLDTIAPTLTITTGGGIVVGQTNETISGTIDAADADLPVSIYLGDNQGPPTLLATATPDANGDWSASVNLSQHAGVDPMPITAWATDAAGNMGESNTIYDTADVGVAPSLTITSPGISTEQAWQTISGTIDVPDAGSTVSIYDGSTLIGTATPIDGPPDAASEVGTWSTLVSLPRSFGSHSITAKATSASGQTMTSNVVDYTLTAPTVAVAITSVLTNHASQTIAGTIDLADVRLTISIYDQTTLLGTTKANAQGDWSFATKLTATQGAQHLLAQATDASGFVGNSNIIKYPLDTTPPTLRITSAGIVGANGSQKITGTIDVADAGLTISIYDGSTLLGSTKANARGDWSYEATLTLARGAQNLTARATDAAGVGSSGVIRSDIAADVEALTAAEIAKLWSQDDVTLISVRDAGVTFGVAQAIALEKANIFVTAPIGDTVGIADTAAQLETLTAAEISALPTIGLGAVTATDANVAIDVAKAKALEAAKIKVLEPTNDFAIVSDTAAHLEALTKARIDGLSSIGVSELYSTDGNVTYSAHQTSAILAENLSVAATGSHSVTEKFAGGNDKVYVDGVLTQQKTVNGDHSYAIVYTHVTGKSYSSAETVYGSAGVKVANAFDETDGSGILTLSGSGLIVSMGPNAESVTTGVDTFALAAHPNETATATAKGDHGETFLFTPNAGQNPSPWSDTVAGFLAGGRDKDLLEFDASAFGAHLTSANQSADLAALLGGASLNGAGNAVITDLHGDTVTLTGVSLETLEGYTLADFKFI